MTTKAVWLLHMCGVRVICSDGRRSAALCRSPGPLIGACPASCPAPSPAPPTAAMHKYIQNVCLTHGLTHGLPPDTSHWAQLFPRLLSLSPLPARGGGGAFDRAPIVSGRGISRITTRAGCRRHTAAANTGRRPRCRISGDTAGLAGRTGYDGRRRRRGRHLFTAGGGGGGTDCSGGSDWRRCREETAMKRDRVRADGRRSLDRGQRSLVPVGQCTDPRADWPGVIELIVTQPPVMVRRTLDAECPAEAIPELPRPTTHGRSSLVPCLPGLIEPHCVQSWVIQWIATVDEEGG